MLVAASGRPNALEASHTFVARRHADGVVYRIALTEKSGRYERPAG